MKQKSFLLVISFFCCFLLTAPSAYAQTAATTPAGEAIMSTVSKVRSTVSEQQGKLSSDQLDEKLKAIIYPVFNFEEMSMRSLGPYWNQATPEEKKEFVALFSDLLARNYLRKIRENVTKSKVNLVSDSQTGPTAMVRTTVASDDQTVAIDYRLREGAETWRVYDVVIENIGLVSNYRGEFGGIIKKDGFQGLLRRLREKKLNE